MAKSTLETIEVRALDVFINPHDIRRDLYKYVQYISTHNVKRAHRTNEIPPADYKRLSQLLGATNNNASGHDSWVDYVDKLARYLGFVNYDTEGEYKGYTSSEPSFPNNFIEFDKDEYNRFVELPLVEQEQLLFNLLVSKYHYSDNEFVEKSSVGRLKPFPTWGAAVGILPSLNFDNSRRFLFDFLAQNCEVGVWYSTASLIALLKQQAPYFLIPEKPKAVRANQTIIRYANLYEAEYHRYDESAIPDNAPDGFERAEGRYIERFLENIPLILGYLEVAYRQPKSDKYISIGELQAFRLNERFFQLIKEDIPQPVVIVQPNFELYIVSSFYPIKLISQLSAVAEVIKEDTPTLLLKLQKQKVASYAAQNDGADVIKLLEQLSGQPLPQNVAFDLREWTNQAEIFTLYDGFGLLEGSAPLTIPDAFVAQKIKEELELIKRPEEVQRLLRANNAVALYVKHDSNSFKVFPERAQTLFPKQNASPPTEKAAPQAVTIKQEHLLVLYFPSDKLLEQIRKALLEAHCPADIDKERRSLTIKSINEPALKQVIEALKGEYEIRLEDIG